MSLRTARRGLAAGPAALVMAALAGLPLTLAGCSAANHLPRGEGAVVVGIAGCVDGPTAQGGFAAGTVVVLLGTASETPWTAGGKTGYLPTNRVRSQTVSKGQRLTFDLRPGHYVLEADYAGSRMVSWVGVDLRAGQLETVTVPSPCV